MNVFIIEDCHGSYIRKDATTGKYVAIRSKNAAAQFENYDKANNILNNCLTREQKRNYIVSEMFIPDKQAHEKPTASRRHEGSLSVLIPQKEPEVKRMRDKRTMLTQITEDVKVIDMSPWEISLSGLLQFAKNSGEKIAKLNEELSNIDKEIVDLQHYIEFTNLSSYHGFLAYKALRSKLRKRREIKNEFEILRLFESGKAGIESLQAILSTIQVINNKSYAPRKLEELFK